MPANATMVGGQGVDTFIDDISQNTAPSTQTIISPYVGGAVYVNSAAAYTALSGGAPVAIRQTLGKTLLELLLLSPLRRVLQLAPLRCQVVC
jgi:hypothetical protein